MRFLFDNNLAPYLAKAIAALCEPEDVQVVHLRDRFTENTPDVEWIEALSMDADWVGVAINRFKKTPFEREALRRSGLTAFILVKGWGNQKYWDQAAQLVRWWPRIMEQAELVQPGAIFEVPWKFSGKGRFRQS